MNSTLKLRCKLSVEGNNTEPRVGLNLVIVNGWQIPDARCRKLKVVPLLAMPLKGPVIRTEGAFHKSMGIIMFSCAE
jgi:hypothetical protein